MKYLLTYLLFAVSVFAQTTIKPLTQANIEAAITDKPGFVAEIGAGGTVDNAAVVAAIEEDPAAAKAALGPETFVYASDYGVTGDGVADDTAELQAAVTAVASTGKTLVIRGTLKLSDEIIITGAYPTIKISGYGATLVQTNTAKNALTLSYPVTGVIIEGLTITGQGPATHAAAGIYLRNADSSYVGPDYVFRDMTISGFRTGTVIGNVTTLRMDCVTVYNTRIGHNWYAIQTGCMTQLRVTVGDADASGCCFYLDQPSYGLPIIGGEFSGYQKFARIIGTAHVAFESINVEAIGSGIIIDAQGGGEISLRNSKIQQTIAETGSILSYLADGGVNMRFNFANNVTSLATIQTPVVECYGSSYLRGPLLTGETVKVAYVATQGAARAAGTVFEEAINTRRNFAATSLPSDGSVRPGSTQAIGLTSGTGTDDWSTNIVVRQRTGFGGTNRWSSLVNDMLIRVLGTSERTASGNNVETDIQNVTLPIGVLWTNGETVDIELFGNTAANTNNKHFRFYFGGSLYLDFGALPLNAESWTIKIRIQRGSFASGTGYMKLVGTLDYGSGRVIKTAETPSAVIDSSTTIATRVTVLTPTAGNDAVSLGAKTTWTRAVPGI